MQRLWQGSWEATEVIHILGLDGGRFAKASKMCLPLAETYPPPQAHTSKSKWTRIAPMAMGKRVLRIPSTSLRTATDRPPRADAAPSAVAPKIAPTIPKSSGTLPSWFNGRWGEDRGLKDSQETDYDTEGGQSVEHEHPQDVLRQHRHCSTNPIVVGHGRIST
jgi:hypothetical protein